MKRENGIDHRNVFYDDFNEFSSEEKEQEYKKMARIPNANTYEELVNEVRTNVPIDEEHPLQNKQKVKKQNIIH